MDSAITAAARALRAGDPLGALKRVALRDDPPALALRGIAMAQLGDLARARELLRRAARGFGPREAMARARCRTAEAEVALASRELAWPSRGLAAARRTFIARGDGENAVYARLLEVRHRLLLGRLDDAADACATLPADSLPPRLAAVAALLAFEIAVRRIDAQPARVALETARAAAAQSGIPALAAEVAQAGRALTWPAAQLLSADGARSLTLAEVQAVLASPDLIVDGCRRTACQGGRLVALARRPVLFALLRALARAWPGEARRDDLIRQVFETTRPNPSHRARLRVEMGRLRRELRPLAELRATSGGFALAPRQGRGVRLLAPPIDSPDAALLALLSDGEAWSTSALGLALGNSQRTVQRALAALEQAGQARAVGRGRAQRWVSAPVAGFATALLLPLAGGFG